MIVVPLLLFSCRKEIVGIWKSFKYIKLLNQNFSFFKCMQFICGYVAAINNPIYQKKSFKGLFSTAHHGFVCLCRPGLPELLTSTDLISRNHLWPSVGGHRQWCPFLRPVVQEYVLRLTPQVLSFHIVHYPGLTVLTIICSIRRGFHPILFHWISPAVFPWTQTSC